MDDTVKNGVDSVIQDALKKSGIALDDEGKPVLDGLSDEELGKKAPELLLHLVSALGQVSTGEKAAEPADPTPEPAKEPTAFENELRNSFRKAFDGYVHKHVASEEGGDTVEIDPAFIKDHGPALLNVMVGEFAKALLPKDLTIDVPAPGGEVGDASKPVKLKLDLEKVMGNLMQAPGVTVETKPADDAADSASDS